jgi:hypothetical protein
MVGVKMVLGGLVSQSYLGKLPVVKATQFKLTMV